MEKNNNKRKRVIEDHGNFELFNGYYISTCYIYYSN
jgi:hypothetical protein